MSPRVDEVERIAAFDLDGRPVGTIIVAFRDGEESPAVYTRRVSALGNPYWADLINGHGSHLLSSDLVAMQFDRVHFTHPEESP